MQTCVSYDMMTVVHLIGVGNPSYSPDIYRPVWHADLCQLWWQLFIWSVLEILHIARTFYRPVTCRPVSFMIWWQLFIWSVLEILHIGLCDTQTCVSYDDSCSFNRWAVPSVLQILDIARTIIGLYDMWKTYDEKKEIAAVLAKMPKPKLSPSR